MPRPPRPWSRECNCIEDFWIHGDERLVRCAHFDDWAVILVESTDGLPPIYSVQSNVPIWDEWHTEDKAEAEAAFAFAEGRFHEVDC